MNASPDGVEAPVSMSSRRTEPTDPMREVDRAVFEANFPDYAMVQTVGPIPGIRRRDVLTYADTVARELEQKAQRKKEIKRRRKLQKQRGVR